VVTHQLQVERRTGKVRRPETDVLPRDSDVINYRDGPMSGGAICWRGADIRRAVIVARAGVRDLMLSEGECLDCLYR